jgi:hypothetical protein
MTEEEFNDLIEEWHTAPDDSPAAGMHLHEFLGLSWSEYKKLVEDWKFDE